jgi:hypothetical protein
MPELLTYRVGAGSGGSRHPVLKTEEPLTRDEVEKMSPEGLAAALELSLGDRERTLLERATASAS